MAVRLLALVLKRTPQNLDYALDTVRQNAFRLLETEAWDDLPTESKKALLQLSLVSDLPVAVLPRITDDMKLMEKTLSLVTSFIWFDSFLGDHRIHPLYLDFLRSRQDMLSDKEKNEVYQRAALWCSENNFFLDSLKYYGKAHLFERMLEILLSHPLRLPQDACAFMLDVLQDLKLDPEEQSDHSVLLLTCFFTPLFHIGMGSYEEGARLCRVVIDRWENTENPFFLYLLYAAYSNLAFISMHTCTVTHSYDFPEYLEKSLDYFKRSTQPPVHATGAFADASIRSYACLIGEGAEWEEFDRFLAITRYASLYVAETPYNMYYGYADLVACEIAFFKNQHEVAQKYAHDAILKAREKRQFGIESMAEQYLLRMAVQQGDYPLVRELLKQLRAHLDNPDFWNRQLMYDLFVGSFYTQIGLAELVPPWYALDERESALEVRIPIRELVVNVRYCIATRKYRQALTILCNSYPREPQERFHFGELMLCLLLAVAREKAEKSGFDILLLNQGMADFELFGTVDAAVCCLRLRQADTS